MFQIQIPSLDVPLFANCLVALAILVLLYWKTFTQNDLRLPPGPMKFPVINWELAPLSFGCCERSWYPFTTSCPKKLGQEIWSYHAPETGTSIIHCHLIT